MQSLLFSDLKYDRAVINHYNPKLQHPLEKPARAAVAANERVHGFMVYTRHLCNHTQRCLVLSADMQTAGLRVRPFNIECHNVETNGPFGKLDNAHDPRTKEGLPLSPIFMAA